MNPEAKDHLLRLLDLLARAHGEIDAAAGLLPPFTHPAALELRDEIARGMRACRGIALCSGVPPGEVGR